MPGSPLWMAHDVRFEETYSAISTATTVPERTTSRRWPAAIPSSLPASM
jgi:hypothetical protein